MILSVPWGLVLRLIKGVKKWWVYLLDVTCLMGWLAGYDCCIMLQVARPYFYTAGMLNWMGTFSETNGKRDSDVPVPTRQTN